MEKVKDLNDKIMAITTLISENHPELCKYLDEMPITIPNNNDPKMDSKTLEDYYESLKKIVKGYIIGAH